MSWSPETKPRTSLIHIIHQADLMAARIEFEREWNPKFRGERKSTPTPSTKQPIKTKALSNVRSQGLMDMLDNL